MDGFLLDAIATELARELAGQGNEPPAEEPAPVEVATERARQFLQGVADRLDLDESGAPAGADDFLALIVAAQDGPEKLVGNGVAVRNELLHLSVCSSA